MEQQKSPRLSKRLSLFFKNLVKQGDQCNLCNKKFHLFRNKHMCSRCNNSICRSCSKDRGKNRVCNQCKGVFVKLRAQSFISKNPPVMSQVKSYQQNGNAEESKSLSATYEAQEQQEDDEGNFGIDQKLAAKLGFNQTQVENVDMFSDYSTLPVELRSLIENSGIEKTDALENPAAAFGAVLFAMQSLPSQQIVQQITQYVVNFQNENPETKYQLVKIIGKGSQGTVYVGIRKDTGKEYALKKMIPKNEQAEKDMINEIQIMMICNHDNIVNCYETFYFNEAYWMVLDLMHANLTQLIFKTRLTEKLIAYIIRECLNSLVYLHKQHRIHRDLKSDNILISKDGQVKIGDFGFSAQLTQEAASRTSVVGTPS